MPFSRTPLQLAMKMRTGVTEAAVAVAHQAVNGRGKNRKTTKSIYFEIFKYIFAILKMIFVLWINLKSIKIKLILKALSICTL